MWGRGNCGRRFEKVNQPHSCRKMVLEKHFEKKEKAKELFDVLVKNIKETVGRVQVISLPCCIHLFGLYDFLAVLPRKDGLEIRLGLERIIKSPRLKTSVPVSAKYFKNCIMLSEVKEMDEELWGWIKEAYFLKK